MRSPFVPNRRMSPPQRGQLSQTSLAGLLAGALLLTACGTTSPVKTASGRSTLEVAGYDRVVVHDFVD
jgi:hypothetical protein